MTTNNEMFHYPHSIILAISDLMSLSLLIAAFSGAIPIIGGLLTIIYTALRIYELCTVQGWIKRRKDKE